MELPKSLLVVLASLVHDIGKFAQRADALCSEHLANEYCPDGASHSHVLYTDWHIENHLPLPYELESLRSTLARMASAHHKADSSSREERCIQEGDRLSSGNDRIGGESQGTYKSARMESVFSSVSLHHHTQHDTSRRYVLKALDAEGSPLFPVEQSTAKATSYTALYEDFLKALKALPLDMGVAHYLSSVQTVLERFTWCIPSSTYQTRADISLFDHSYTTAAIAQALYHGERPVSDLKHTPLLLLGGELSGIQNFIFGQGEQGDRGASKLLRARSFSLQMLTRSIWLVILERCGLCSVARIMDAGGRFILLLPDTPTVREAVDSVTRAAMRHVLEAFNGVVRVSFAIQELTATALVGSFLTVFQQMNDKLEREKLRPFAPLLTEGFSPIIGIQSADYAAYGPCPFCGLRPSQGENEEAGCGICRALIQQVGRRLPDARYAVFSREGKGFPLFDGLRLRLEKDTPSRAESGALDILNLKDRTAFSASPAAGYVPHITEADFSRWEAEKRSMPEEDGLLTIGQPKTFDVLAQEACIRQGNNFRSIPYLAACKADVDNLGMIFGIGLEERASSNKDGKDTPLHQQGNTLDSSKSDNNNSFSISCFAMLSRMMHHFFSSYLIRVIEEKFPNIYVVFAGGDDLFVLGPWSETVHFAETLYDAFRRFTGGNPDVTLSAGIALAKSGLPMRSIKELAEEALNASKAYSPKPDTEGQQGNPSAVPKKKGPAVKNAVTLFGVTCPWPAFYPRLEQGEWLEDMCLQGGITQGFVRRLLGYSRQARDFAKGEISAGLYRSHMIYDITRNCNKKKLNQDDLSKLLALCHNKDDFEQMEISITWALYRTRTTA